MRRPTAPALRVLNWGLGQDSTTIALLAEHGELPPFDAIIWADTQQEPQEVYDTLEWMLPLLTPPVYRVTAGDLGAAILEVAHRHAEGHHYTAGHVGQVPFYAKNAPNLHYDTASSGGPLWRKCTEDYKIVPIRQQLRRILGVKALGRLPHGVWVEQCIGFPIDELHRTFCSDVQWIVNTFPLIDLRMRKHDCARWLTEHGYQVPPKSSCRFCLAGETHIMTPEGSRPIRDLVGRTRVLVPSKRSGWGAWKEVEIRAFGRQRLWEVTLGKPRIHKVIYATAEHRWVTADKLGCYLPFKPTTALEMGDRLPSCRFKSVLASRHPVLPSPFGIAHGFTFGDGSAPARDRTPASVNLFGAKDAALLPYFALCPHTMRMQNEQPYIHIYGLPRLWKHPPAFTESRGYLLGWLAGYFAADGHVSKSGQVCLNSANEKHMLIARDICDLLGLQTSPVRMKDHPAIGGLKRLYSLTIYPRDLPLSFWLIPHHRTRIEALYVEKRPRREEWRVVSVKPTDRVEEVYCPIVPGREMFTLADNVVTGNCPYHSNAYWRRMRDTQSEEWAKTVAFEAALHQGKLPGVRGTPYLHKSMRPLPLALIDEPDTQQEELFCFACNT